MKLLVDELAVDQKLIYAFILAALIAFILIIVSLIILSTVLSKYSTQIRGKSNTASIYVVDVEGDRVNYFNTSKLKERKTITLTSFYNQFSSHDRENLIGWISDLLSNEKDVQNYIEVSNVSTKKKNKTNMAILQVQKIDAKKRIVYLESHQLKYSTRKAHTNEITSVISKESANEIFKDRKGRGTTFCLNFFSKKTMVDELNHLSYVEIKNILSNMTNDSVLLTINDSMKFNIFNYNVSDKIEALTFIDVLKSKINSYLLIESLTEDIGFSIGCAENHYFKNEYNSLLRTVTNLSEYAKDNGKEVMFFDENTDHVGDELTFKTEVENIISNDKLNYLYQPLFDISKNKVFGYFSSIEYVGDVFKNINDLKNFAIRTDDDKKLFTTISKNCVLNFIQEKTLSTLKLFMNVSQNEIQYVDRYLFKIKGVEEANLIIVLSEKDLLSVSDDAEVMENISNSIRSFKSKGFEVAINIDDKILNLSHNFYSLFDYFIMSINAHVGSELTENLPVFKGLIEQLLKYKRQIIAIDISSWDVVELVYKFGIGVLCGDVIATKNENILPLDKKVLMKIKKLEA